MSTGRWVLKICYGVDTMDREYEDHFLWIQDLNGKKVSNRTISITFFLCVFRIEAIFVLFRVISSPFASLLRSNIVAAEIDICYNVLVSF